MKKTILVILVSFFIVLPAFMGGMGEVSVTKKLSVITTEYFDFIFPEESEPTAQHLAQEADDTYRKVAAFLNIESTERFPVVITPETNLTNGYFIAVPIFRIVIYDTVPFDSLAVFSDSLASIFYHEVVHALSTTIRTPFWSGYSDIFGDIQSPPMMSNLTPAIAEGTAVLAESLDGEGRLNSAYALHVIKQAKIEGKFPDWRDITGAYRLYTDGSLPYIFGGAFFNYIYERYGAKKFTDFWYELSKINITFYEGVFKKVYSVSLDTVWQDFEDSIYIEPLSSSAQALFSQKKLLRATDGQLFQHLTASPDGIVWQDGFTGTVYFLPNNSENKRPKALYAKDSFISVDLGRLHFSRDGRYLASSGYTSSSSLGNKAENIVRVYDMVGRKFVHSQKGIREGTVLRIPEDAVLESNSPFNGVLTVLAGVQTNAGLASLAFYDMDAKKDSQPLRIIPFERNSILFEPLDAGNGLIVALLYTGGKWQFFVYDVIADIQRIYAIDDASLSPSNIGDIYASDTMLYMSYAPTANAQPVLARINLSDFSSDTLTVYIQTEQASGGVFSPVLVLDTVEDTKTEQVQDKPVQIAYISRYYEHRTLSVLPITASDSFETARFIGYTPTAIETPLKNAIEFPIKDYQAGVYAKKGIFIPLLGSINFNPFTNFLPLSISIGASAMTIDPTGRLFMFGGAGYDIQTNNFTTALSTIFNENYFTAEADVFTASSPVGFETLAAKLHTNIKIPIGYSFNNVTVANTLSYFYLAEKNDNLLDGNTLHNVATISFSHVRRTGQFFYDRVGVALGAQLAIQKNFTYNTALVNEYAIFLGVQTPFVLPFKNPARFTLNLPGKVFAYRYFNSNSRWKVESTFVLFAYDIQKPLPISFAPLFFQRITLDAGLNSVWYTIGDPELTVHGSLFFTVVPNTGLAVQSSIDLGALFTWNPYIDGIKGLEIGFKLGIGL